MSDMSVNTLSNILAAVLVAGSTLFAVLSLSNRDFFLFMGNFCCLLGNIIMAVQTTGNNSGWSAIFIHLTIVSTIATFRQWNKFRKHGCPEDEVEEAELTPDTA